MHQRDRVPQPPDPGLHGPRDTGLGQEDGLAVAGVKAADELLHALSTAPDVPTLSIGEKLRGGEVRVVVEAEDVRFGLALSEVDQVFVREAVRRQIAVERVILPDAAEQKIVD